MSMASVGVVPADSVDAVAELAGRLRIAIGAGVRISDEVMDVVLATTLAGGHLLLEDHPGVGKTRLARSLARAIGGAFTRVQATIDLLPSDVVGASVWLASRGEFEFRPGPVFTNVLLVDEINRATPKTQSGLLEAMQEHQVTVDGVGHRLPSPFVVVATQNPSAGHDGTHPLPPAQLDRFLARVSLGYPDARTEVELLRDPPSEPDLAAVARPDAVEAARRTVTAVHAGDRLLHYLVTLVRATREDPRCVVGASPRAGVLLLGAARARAAMAGREFVLPDDVQGLAVPVLAHRLQVADRDPRTAEAVVLDAVSRTPAR